MEGIYHCGFGALHVAGRPDQLMPIFDTLKNLPLRVLIDTARAYGNSEKEIGNWMKKNIVFREKFFIVSKIGITNDPFSPYINEPQTILKDALFSIKQLKTNPDALLLHRLDPNKTLAEIGSLYQILSELKQNGTIKYIGVCECTSTQLEYLAENYGVDFIELAYSPFTRRAEKNAVCDVIKKYNIFTIAYSTALRGLLNPIILDLIEMDWILDFFDILLFCCVILM